MVSTTWCGLPGMHFCLNPIPWILAKRKRLSPEQTLLYENSDCDDRAALFFYLVKEIYDLPMIVLAYPKHITIAVQFDKPVGKPIVYNGQRYYVCEPTPQKKTWASGNHCRNWRRLVMRWCMLIILRKSNF